MNWLRRLLHLEPEMSPVHQRTLERADALLAKPEIVVLMKRRERVLAAYRAADTRRRRQ